MAKHHTQSRQGPGPELAKGSRRGNKDKIKGTLDGNQIQVCHLPLNLLRTNRQWQCCQCKDGGHNCEVVPNGPCRQCKKHKWGCSLMPQNPSTSKTDHHALLKSKLLEFCHKQAEELQAGVKKGKHHNENSPNTGKSEGSGLSLSSLTALSGLGNLALDSGGSSTVKTPADTLTDIPAILPQPPLPECPTPAPTSAPKNCEAPQPSGKSASKHPAAAPTQDLTDVTAKLPGTSQLLKLALRQASRSCSDKSPMSDKSPVSDEGSNAARITRLEARLAAVKEWANQINGRLKQFFR